MGIIQSNEENSFEIINSTDETGDDNSTDSGSPRYNENGDLSETESEQNSMSLSCNATEEDSLGMYFYLN